MFCCIITCFNPCTIQAWGRFPRRKRCICDVAQPCRTGFSSLSWSWAFRAGLCTFTRVLTLRALSPFNRRLCVRVLHQDRRQMEVSWVITPVQLSPGEGTGGSGGSEGVSGDDEWKCTSPVPLFPSSSNTWSIAHCTQGSDKHGFTAKTQEIDLT